jgi:hypothetical protein
MIRLTQCISLLIIFVLDVSAQKIGKSGLKENNLRGKVSYLEETTYAGIDHFGEAKKDSLLSKCIFKYDINGSEIEKYEHYIVFNTPEFETKTLYNEKGNKIQQSYYQSEKDYGSTIYKYDSKDNLIETEYYFCGLLTNKIINKYDESGNNIESMEYNEDGELAKVKVFKYDEKRNVIERSFYNKFGELNSKTIQVYDNNSNVIEEERYDFLNPSFSRKHTYKYDNNGNKIEKKYYHHPDYILKQIDNCKYDNYGNVTEDLTIYSNFSKTKTNKNEEISGFYYKYEYDNLNNWIKKLKLRNYILEEITERVIKYYPD